MIVALWQSASRIADPDQVLPKVAAAATDAAAQGASLLVLPERALAANREDLPRFGDTEHRASVGGSLIQAVTSVTRSTGLAILTGLVEREDATLYNSALLVPPKGKVQLVRQVGPNGPSLPSGSRRSIVRLLRAPLAVLFGEEWDSLLRVREVLADPACPRVLVVLARTTGDHLLRRAQTLADSDAVTVVACNAARPEGDGGSCVVTADGEVLVAFGDEEEIAVVDLIRQRPSPVERLPERLRWDELPPEDGDQVKLAIFVLIGWSQAIEEEVARQGKRRHAQLVAHSRIRERWSPQPVAELWRRLDAEDRDRLIASLRVDIERFVRLHTASDYGLDEVLRAPNAWCDQRPIANDAAAGRAIFLGALRGVLSCALQLDPSLSRAQLWKKFAAKLAATRDDPSSVYYLTQPYLQAVARNFLRDEIRVVGRAASRHVERLAEDRAADAGSDPAVAVSIADLAKLLTPLEREILDARFAHPELSDLAVAERLGRAVAEVEKATVEMRARVRRVLP